MLRDEVIIAFSKTPYPGDEALTACSCDECRGEVSRFEGKKWSRLSLQDLREGDCGASIPSLTPTAFHYFLPGLLIVALDNPDIQTLLLGRVIRRLVVSDRAGEARRRNVEQIHKRLSSRQRQVLVDVMRQVEDSVPHDPVTWNSALGNLIGGTVIPYSQASADLWLQERLREIGS